MKSKNFVLLRTLAYWKVQIFVLSKFYFSNSFHLLKSLSTYCYWWRSSWIFTTQLIGVKIQYSVVSAICQVNSFFFFLIKKLSWVNEFPRWLWFKHKGISSSAHYVRMEDCGCKTLLHELGILAVPQKTSRPLNFKRSSPINKLKKLVSLWSFQTDSMGKKNWKRNHSRAFQNIR